jgi:hypothetical protein
MHRLAPLNRRRCPRTQRYLALLSVIEKCTKDQANIILRLFSMIEKSAKDQADGKCSRTGPFPPTVGIAYARSVFLALFSVIEKCTKDQADGKCSRTGPFPPTVGVAPARSVRARVWRNQDSYCVLQFTNLPCTVVSGFRFLVSRFQGREDGKTCRGF